jgi:hypothetical protein
MSYENFDFQTSWNLRFPPLQPKTSSLFLLDTSTIDSDIKVLNHILLTLASDHDKKKIKYLYTKFFTKNKLVELTYHKAGLLMQYPQKYQAKKGMKFRVLKVESANSTMSGSQSFRGSFMIPLPVTTLIKFNRFIFSEKFCMKVFDFCLWLSLASVKSM